MKCLFIGQVSVVCLLIGHFSLWCAYLLGRVSGMWCVHRMRTPGRLLLRVPPVRSRRGALAAASSLGGLLVRAEPRSASLGQPGAQGGTWAWVAQLALEPRTWWPQGPTLRTGAAGAGTWMAGVHGRLAAGPGPGRGCSCAGGRGGRARASGGIRCPPPQNERPTIQADGTDAGQSPGP